MSVVTDPFCLNVNTGEMGEVLYQDGTRTMEPIIWCDICGWAAPKDKPNDKHHFCHRHKPAEVRAFMDGSLSGYFERKAQLDLLYRSVAEFAKNQLIGYT